MAWSVFNQAAALALDVFDYNRGNFQYDRKQRQSMEYELADMRIEQVALWRKDVRDFCTLTPRKMEIYLLVIALELGFCVMALCKARVPPGAPPWLVACHTLAVIGALLYLFLALWFGMHAFVSSQAYKVRILTQLVRLPVPTWRSLEAARTYSSAFEKLPKGQMLRVPFAMGSQEEQAQRPGSQEPPTPSQNADDKTPADPWGLERRGDKIAELLPNVNTTEVERQRHIWLAREAAKFYQTYDAFCRISMSTGTSCLALFFCYHCMTYVMAENAAPVSAFAGMIVFLTCACYLIRNDLMLTGAEYWTKFFMVMASPTISFVVAYQTGHNQGHPGAYAHLIVVSLFLHGFSLVHSLMLFRVREMQTGAVLPTAFRKVLYIDPFGWAKHSGTWWRQYAHLMNTRRGSVLFRLRSMSNLSLSSFSDAGGDDAPTQPTMQCVNTAAPKRPEDVEAEPSLASRPSCANLGGQPQDTDGNLMNVSFRPGTFSRTDVDAEGDRMGRTASSKGDIATGTDIHGEKPGLVPWRVYFVITISMALCWWTAAAISMYRTFHGKALFGSYKKPSYGSLNPGQVLPIPELLGKKVETAWDTKMLRPEGLACDPDGRVFATIGRSVDGRRGLLHGEIASTDGAFPSVQFAEAPACSDVEANFGRIQDFALMGCTSTRNCTAAILTKRGEHLVSCPLGDGSSLSLLQGQSALAMPLGRGWLRDRGAEPLEDEPEAEEGFLQPEEISSLSIAPCASGQSFHAVNECVAVGTTGRRVAQLGLAGLGDRGTAWVPRRLLDADRGEVPRSGTLALFGQHYLAALYPSTSKISLMDLRSGGSSAGTWRLPKPKGVGQWASICAGREAIFAMEDAENPTLWRFTPTHPLED